MRDRMRMRGQEEDEGEENEDEDEGQEEEDEDEGKDQEEVVVNPAPSNHADSHAKAILTEDFSAWLLHSSQRFDRAVDE